MKSATHAMEEFVMPANGGPLELAIAANGEIWFTANQGNQIGRLRPSDGEVTLYPIPTPKSGPVGITIDSQG